MRILFLGDEAELRSMIDAREGEGLPSFFFADTLPLIGAPRVADLAVAPAARFILGCAGPFALPVFASGPASLIAEAFQMGCADYLRVPWTGDELAVRAFRVVNRLGTQSGGWEYSGDGCLRGPGGSVNLSSGGRLLMDLLVANLGRPVSREAVCAVLGLDPSGSRSVDMRVSRLRAAIDGVSGEGENLRLRCLGGAYVLSSEFVCG